MYLSLFDFNRTETISATAYAAFLTAIARRECTVPASWGAANAKTPSSTCAGTSAPGTYAPPPVGCNTNATTVAVTFDVREQTVYGETVYVSGSIPLLGNWDTGKAVELTAYRYTSSDPLWSGTVTGLSAGEGFNYRYFKTGTDGVTVTFEGGTDRTYTVPEGCERSVVQSDIWQQ